jgi:hypothetical protein
LNVPLEVAGRCVSARFAKLNAASATLPDSEMQQPKASVPGGILLHFHAVIWAIIISSIRRLNLQELKKLQKEQSAAMATQIALTVEFT